MKWIPVGRVLATSGLRGEVKFHYYNEVQDEFFNYTSLFALKGGEYIELKPEGIRYRKRFFYFSFPEFSTLEEISFLVTKELFVREGDLPQLSEGEYYEFQLIGLNVIDEDGISVGKVTKVLHTGASDILIVKGEKEFMVPMVEDFVNGVDVEKGIIRVDRGGLIA